MTGFLVINSPNLVTYRQTTKLQKFFIVEDGFALRECVFHTTIRTTNQNVLLLNIIIAHIIIIN